MPTPEHFDLERFVAAQAHLFDGVVEELRSGRKRGHWMWFVFPQLRGLGHSAMAQLYGIGSLDEARHYLAHPTLGPRLLLCTRTVLGIAGRSLSEIFGSPDDMKFCSSMTLFALARGRTAEPFREALDRYCQGQEDERTLDLLSCAARRNDR